MHASDRGQGGVLRLFKPNQIGFSQLRGDFSGGLTAAIVALPLALAFGVASGAGPLAGLYGAIGVGFFAALFGGTASQISGPTGPMTVIAASVFTQFGDQPAVAFTVVMLTGVFQMLFGTLRIGGLINLMPYPVISGFMSGVGGLLLLMQCRPLLALDGSVPLPRSAAELGDFVSAVNPQALLIGAIATGLCFLTPRPLARVLPSPLIALLVCTGLSLTVVDIPVLGVIPAALPSPQFPAFDFARLDDMLVAALVLAALGAIDSLLTSLVADNATASYHDSDRELFGQGVGNLVAGLFGGIPGAGATIRTLTNIQSGGRTVLSGMLHALVLLAIAVGLGPVVGHIPEAALAGLLVKVGIDVIDWPFLRRMRRVPRGDLLLMGVVLVLTIVVDVITAVAVGIVLASLSLVKTSAEVAAESIRSIDDMGDAPSPLSPEESALLRRAGKEVQYLHLAGLMSFGAANDMGRRFARLDNFRVLVLDLVDVSRIDGSAGLALEMLIQRSLAQGRQVVVVGLSLPVARVLNQLGSLDQLRDAHRFTARGEALEAVIRLLEASVTE